MVCARRNVAESEGTFRGDRHLELLGGPEEETLSSERASAPQPSRGALMPVLVAGVLAIGVVVAGMTAYAGVPKLPGLEGFHLGTSVVAGVIHAVGWLAALTLLGLLCAVLLLKPHAPEGARELSSAPHPLGSHVEGWLGWARVASYVWLGSSIVGMPLVSAAALGVPFTYAVFGFDTFLSSSQTAQMWLVQTLVAAVVAALVTFGRTIGGLTVAGYLIVLGLLPSVVVGTVSVGRDHDFATDAALVASLGLSAWAAMALGVLLAGSGSETDTDMVTATQRHQWVSLPALLVVVAGGLVVSWQGLAGESPTGSIFGVLHLTAAAALVLAIVNWFVRLGLAPTARLRSIGIDVVLLGIAIGADVAANLVAPPRYAVPQSIQENYLGYTVDHAPTLATLLGPGRPNVFFVTVTVLALGLYWFGYLRLRRRGIDWPVSRLALWTLGWAVMFAVSATGLWKFSGAMFSVHMGVHMSVNMVAPVLIVMGAPITLALRVLPSHRGSATPGPREVLTALLAWRPLNYLMHPLAVWLYFVTAFYGLYFSSLFDWAMRYHWAHQFMNVHFMFTGLLFYGLVIGADKPPRPLPYVGKIGFLFSAMPFHAFFAVGILSSPALLAPTFYPSLDIAWMGDLLADQNLGGQITWATGEIPMLMVIIALVFQWVKEDTRDAKRKDRAMDSGLDDSFEAYNAMLQQLSEQHGGARRGPQDESDR